MRTACRRCLVFMIAVASMACGGGKGGGDPGSSKDADAADMVDAAPDNPSFPFVPAVEGEVVTISNGQITLRYDLASGRFDLGGDPGKDGVFGAYSRAVLVADGNQVSISSAGQGPRAWKWEWADDFLGKSLQARFDSTPAGGAGTVSLIVHIREGSPLAMLHAAVSVPGTSDVRILSIDPLVARGVEGGGLFLGKGTSNAVVLDNGSDIMFDFVADIAQVGERVGLFSTPGFGSNWDSAVCTGEKSCVVAGFVTADRAFPIVATDFQEPEAVAMGAGEKALSLFDLRCHYRPYRSLDPDRTLRSETATVVFTQDPRAALVEYGRNIAKACGKPPWPSVPASWNSWGGGSGSHGLGTNIDETIVLQNLDLAAQDYLPFGMDYFVIDDGWQDGSGYWNTNQGRFPRHGDKDGMAWMSEEIGKRGFIPGLWMSPFRVETDSALFKDHPEWMLKTDEIGTGMLGKGTRVLDLSHPGARAHLTTVLKRVFGEWGYRWLKLDFGYYGLFGSEYFSKGKSAMEVYREGLKLVREAIGKDSFFLNVAAMGAGFGIVDGERLTLDNEPWWGDPQSLADQGFKATVLTAAHRYYLGNTLWVNHPDLLFFREDYGLTADEATAFTLFVAIHSGIFKLGESFAFMHDHTGWLDLTGRLLPVYQGVPEPLDLFDLRWPETWRLPVTGPDGTYEVWGLFHWGKNRDVARRVEMGEEDRAKRIDLPATSGHFAALDSLAGQVLSHGGKALLTGGIDVPMKARTGRLVTVKPVPADLSAPRFLASDRHVMGGAVEVAKVEEKPASRETTVTFKLAVPGRDTKVYFIAPGEGEISVSVKDGAGGKAVETAYEDCRLVEVSFTPEKAGAAVVMSVGK